MLAPRGRRRHRQTKPAAGSANVLCNAIPNSPYSIRLFPGLLAQHEWGMDFVDTGTGEPVGLPPGFRIYSADESGAMP